MLRKFLYFFSVVFACSMFCSYATCDEMPDQSKPQIYTNQDIERYQTPSDARTQAVQPPPRPVERKVSRRDKQQNSSDNREGEYWCKRASTQNKKIERAKEEVTATERYL